MNLERLTEIPKKKRIAIYVAIPFAIIFLYYFAIYRLKAQNIEELKTTWSQIEIELNKKRMMARNLPKYKKEVARLKEKFKELSKKLPQKEEIPSLLNDISNLGKRNGIEFIHFEPKTEIKKEFYAEIPIFLSLSGTYNDFLKFFHDLGRLERIVNVSEVEMGNPTFKDGRLVLKTELKINIFRFIKEEKKRKK